MRIVHIYKDFFPPLAGGITRYLSDIADEAARRGHQVDVHVAGVRHSRRDVLPSGVVVHRHRELARMLSTPIAPGLVREPSLHGDVVHAHMPNPLGELGIALSRRHVPTVVSFHGQLGRQRILEPLYGPVRQRVLDRAAVVFASCDKMGEAEELASVRSKVEVLPYGVSPSVIAQPAADTHADDRLRVIFVGRLVYYKGLDILLDAMSRVPDASLTIVGEGPLRSDLEAQAVRLGMQDRVRLAGSVSDQALRELYGSHDAAVLPSVSRAEAFGLSMAEAMASGLPVVSTRLGTGTDWVNVHEESGLVVEPGDAEALAGALARLVDPAERRRLGAGAQARAHRLFSFDDHVDRLLAVYEEVAG